MISPPTQAEQCLGPLAQVPVGEGRMFRLTSPDQAEPAAIAVFHLRSGAVHATQAACPHRNGPLADGILGGTTVICPLHGRKFDVATGAALSGECGLATFPIRLTEAGDIMIGAPIPTSDSGGS